MTVNLPAAPGQGWRGWLPTWERVRALAATKLARDHLLTLDRLLIALYDAFLKDRFGTSWETKAGQMKAWIAAMGRGRRHDEGGGRVAGLRAGEGLAILGPSGCGKSTLVRGLAGIWPLKSGAVRLDNADLSQWPPDTLGRYIGYLPQNVELIAGTVAENIARFDPDAISEQVIKAAKLAGVHDLILHLPDGYNSQVGPDGRALSGGQRQRIGLARALYGDPFLIILDEPNSNLDAQGEEALASAIADVRARGAIVIAVAHRPSLLASVDLVLLMKDGKSIAFGPKEKLVGHLLPDPRQARPEAARPDQKVTAA